MAVEGYYEMAQKNPHDWETERTNSSRSELVRGQSSGYASSPSHQKKLLIRHFPYSYQLHTLSKSVEPG